MSQVTENKVISAPVPMTPLQEFWHYFKRNKGAGCRAGLRRHRAVYRDLCQLDCTL